MTRAKPKSMTMRSVNPNPNQSPEGAPGQQRTGYHGALNEAVLVTAWEVAADLDHPNGGPLVFKKAEVYKEGEDRWVAYLIDDLGYRWQIGDLPPPIYDPMWRSVEYRTHDDALAQAIAKGIEDEDYSRERSRSGSPSIRRVSNPWNY